MKMLLAAATALTLSGAAFSQTTTTVETTETYTPTGATVTQTMVTVDPNVALVPVPSWNEQQRAMWDEHFTHYPAHWTEAQRTAYRQQLLIPPVQWTPAQRDLYQQHYVYLPSTWTADQRAMYQQQMAAWQTPWASTQTAWTGTSGDYAMAAAGDRIVQPSNANPERDARGIAVISDPALVPAGFNGHGATAMGGPLVDPATGEPMDAERNYPACTASITDNCIQLYERGVRASLASWSGTTGGHADASTAVGGPYEPVDKSMTGTSETAYSDSSAHASEAMGGPVEARSGYPPCTQPGPGQDSCIQLYERGVTGRDN